jgi:DNA gyrase/topoisomerase IV subunit A
MAPKVKTVITFFPLHANAKACMHYQRCCTICRCYRQWCFVRCVQADAVLGMALRRLTSLETGKLEEEARDLAARIAGLKGLLSSPTAVLDVVESEAKEIAERFGDERRSRVCALCDLVDTGFER